MENFPKSTKSTFVYGNLVWDANEKMYKYNETITHFCIEEAVKEFADYHKNVIKTENARDSKIVIDTAQAEIDWAAKAEATKT